jgi:thimet oligopeptidase
MKSGRVITDKEYVDMVEGPLASVEDVIKLLPVSVADIDKRLDMALSRAEKDLSSILSISPKARTFNNTARAYDDADVNIEVIGSGFAVAKLVHPDKSIRDAAQAALLKMSSFAIDRFLTVDIYKAFQAYVDHGMSRENLNPEQRYFVQESMKGFKRAGLHLPAAELARVKALQKELADLSMNFAKNIAEDKSALHLSADLLSGTSPDFINSLPKAPDGKLIVRCNHPSFKEIMYHCSVGSTRRDFLQKFDNRAYPANKEILEKIISKRDELAKLLGFSSYADLDVDNQMAKSATAAESFIRDLAKKVAPKEKREFDRLVADLPEGVSLSDDKSNVTGVSLLPGKLDLCDLRYVQEMYRKKHFKIDDREIAQYFQMEKTVQGIFDIYQQFLNLDFKFLTPTGLWHKDAALIEVHKKGNGSPEGYIFLDLYPRDVIVEA